ncbi:MAG: hypothetical protein OES09_10655 [Gammaproteobacteria bacterium]|nr:hypothetical protein [Gammaproteobacteria bacterium]
MANDFFTHLANIVPDNVRALAAHVNNVADEIESGFNKLPTHLQFRIGTANFGVDTGAANAFVVTVQSQQALTNGALVEFQATNAVTGACTINVNALGVKSLVFIDGAALTSGAIALNMMVSARYDSTNDYYVLMSPSPNFPPP